MNTKEFICMLIGGAAGVLVTAVVDFGAMKRLYKEGYKEGFAEGEVSATCECAAAFLKDYTNQLMKKGEKSES